MSRFWTNLKETFHAIRNIRTLRREMREFGLKEYTDILKRGRELDVQRGKIEKNMKDEESELLANISSFFKKVESDVAKFESAQEGALNRLKEKSDAETAEVQTAMKDMREMQQQLLKDLTAQKGTLVQRATQQRLIEISENLSASNNALVSPTQLLEQLKNLSTNQSSSSSSSSSSSLTAFPTDPPKQQ